MFESMSMSPAGPRARLQIVTVVIVAAIAYAAAIVWVGSGDVLRAMRRFTPEAVFMAAGLGVLGVLPRLWRWTALLRGLGYRLPVADAVQIYLAGLCFTLTPGKAGESLRSVLLLRHGVEVPRSLAAFVADRLSDLVGVLLLAMLATRLSGPGLRVLDVAASAAVVFALLAPRVMTWAASPTMPTRGWRWLRALGASAQSTCSAFSGLWASRHWPGWAAAGALAYGIQALAFAGLVQAAGIPLPPLHCVAMYLTATLLGASSMVPAGLGVMEAALVAQMVAAGAGTDVAVAVALISRGATLWVVLAIGTLAAAALGGRREAAAKDNQSTGSDHGA